MKQYVSLHNHTIGSIGDSLITPKQLIEATKEAGQTAVAVTDHGSMSRLWETYKVAKKAGIKLIAGCEVYFVDDADNEDDTTLRHLILIAKNQIGYQNILRINKQGFDQKSSQGKRAISRVDWKLLEKLHEGLICTSACGNGVVAQLVMQDRNDEAEEAALRLKKIFGDDFALELQPHNLQRRASAFSGAVNQQKVNLALKKMGEKHNIRCIVSTDAHYIKKEHHKAHDVYLCNASNQPITSGNRLRYDKPDFYVKNADEVYEHFTRHMKVWGEEFVESLFENTIYYADKCEDPAWISPEVITGEKSQLPEFPYKDEPDIGEFRTWKEQNENIPFSEVYKSEIPEDAQFYRYRSEKGLFNKVDKGKIPGDDIKESIEQMLEEFDVFEFRGFSSYMLITADFLNWCKRNFIAIGPGRGCLTGDTEVLTDNGFVRLDSIDVGDVVFTHSGRKKLVYERFTYPVNETGIEIGTDYSFSSIKLTKDHKVYASIAKETDHYVSMKSARLPSYKSVKRWNEPDIPKWITADELKVGDYIFMPFPKRSHIYAWDGSDYLDLSQFTQDPSLTIFDDKIEQKIPKANSLSLRKIARETGLSRSAVQNVKYDRAYGAITREKVSEYLVSLGSTLEEWMVEDNEYVKVADRRLCKDNELLYVLGRWVGDGWSEHHPEKGYQVGFAFHSEDADGIDRIFSYFDNKGFKVQRYNSANKKLTQLVIKGRLLHDFFTSMCDSYKQSSNTKHLPDIFRTLSCENIKSLLLGLSDADGTVEIGKDYKKENIDTTSRRLALEVKEALLYLEIPSSINTRPEYYTGKYICSESYKIRFKGLKLERSSSSLIIKSGYFCKITSLSEVKLDVVYDISVEDDTSYLTTNYAVHNSVGGSLTAYVNEIHQAYPKKYGLIFARFLNKFKEAFPDIDNDIAPSGRDKLHGYLRSKYGEGNVAHVSNINTITPKVYARDIARIFEFDGSRSAAAEKGNLIADSIPSEMKSVKQALEEAPLFAEYAKQYPELAEFAELLCGLPRAWSTHAGGIVISKRPLEGLVPLRRDAAGALVLEYDKEIAEENGLVKIDTLGLETLDIIGETYKLIQETGKNMPEEPFDYEIDDQKTYNLIGEGDTFGVFQLGSTAVTVCKKVKPNSVEDIALVSALVRPAAKDTIPDLLKVRNGEAEMTLMHPTLHRAFASTYGYGLYEESLMYLAQDVAGWDLHDADKLRKLTKEKGKNPEKVAKWREEFIEGAQKNKGLSEEIATKIWDDTVSVFSGYGFNKSLYFLESVDVFTSEGNFIISKSIKDVQPGEFVRSRDEETGDDIYIEVVGNHDHGELDVVEVELVTGERVRCTMNHKFRVQETDEMLPLWKIVENSLSIVIG